MKAEAHGGIPARKQRHEAVMTGLVLGTICISFAPVFPKLAEVSAICSAFYRVLFGGLVLACVAVSRRERFLTDPRVFLWQLLLGAIFAGDLAVWHVSILEIGPGLATLLASFQVLLLTLYDVLVLRMHVPLRRRLSIPVALFGLACIVGLDWDALGEGTKFGMALGLLTAFFYASYLLLLPKGQHKQGPTAPFAGYTVLSLSAALCLLVLALMNGDSLAAPSYASWGWLLLLGLLCQAAGQFLIFLARAKIAASRVGLIVLLQPCLVVLWDLSIFGQVFSPLQYAGAGLTVLAIAMGAR